MVHFLQSTDWAAFQQDLGRRILSDNGDGWSYQAILETGRFNTRLYCPYGPVARSPQALRAALTSLETNGRTHGVTFVRVEPTNRAFVELLGDRNYRKVTYNQLQPEHTQIIDLVPPETEIIAAMKPSNRNLYRTYIKKGITITASNDPDSITILLSLLKKMADRTGIMPHSDAYLKQQVTTLFTRGAATLYYASVGTVPIAAALVYDSSSTRYYAHAADDEAYRKLSAPTALLAQIIIDAKQAGKQEFDLFGIAPAEIIDHKWSGFTRFKQSFGGRPVTYAGAWDKPLQPLRYGLYRLYQRLRSSA